MERLLMRKGINNLIQKELVLNSGNETKYIELTSPLSKSFAYWISIMTDMDFVIKSFGSLLKRVGGKKDNKQKYTFLANTNEKHIINVALYRSAIITYAKAFTRSKGRTIKLSDQIFKNNQLKILHKELINERNNYHAHSGFSKSESFIPIITFKNNDKKNFQLEVFNFKVSFKDKTELDGYIELTRFVHDYANKKASECGNALLKKEIIKNITILYNEVNKVINKAYK
jgi:hypothetical protein